MLPNNEGDLGLRQHGFKKLSLHWRFPRKQEILWHSEILIDSCVGNLEPIFFLSLWALFVHL